MLTIAKSANASNETLYRWYGDKAGLVKVLVERNAATVKSKLQAAIQSDADALSTLSEIAPVLLSMLLGERAVCLNRAAAADTSGELGAAIAAEGRDAVFPLINRIMQAAIDQGALNAPSAGWAGEAFINLLVGDLQVRRVNRSMLEPDEQTIAKRARDAMLTFCQLCTGDGRESTAVDLSCRLSCA
jgi:AcrR family transcriptional regulator